MPFLIFIAACLAIVALGWTVSKITGSKAYFIEDWKYDEGETIIWRDDRADFAAVARLGPAAAMKPLRVHRSQVVATSRRIIVGAKTLTGKQMVRYVLYCGPGPDDQARRLDGGLLTRGYSTLLIQRTIGETSSATCIVLKPVAGANSTFNLSELRIHTDLASSFAMPSSAP